MKTYPTTHKLHPEMLKDANRWVMEQINGQRIEPRNTRTTRKKPRSALLGFFFVSFVCFVVQTSYKMNLLKSSFCKIPSSRPRTYAPSTVTLMSGNWSGAR